MIAGNLQMKKPKHGEAKKFSEGHSTNQWRSQDLNLGRLNAEARILTALNETTVSYYLILLQIR